MKQHTFNEVCNKTVKQGKQGGDKSRIRGDGYPG